MKSMKWAVQHGGRAAAVGFLGLGLICGAVAQNSSSSSQIPAENSRQQDSTQPQPSEQTGTQGKVLFSRGTDTLTRVQPAQPRSTDVLGQGQKDPLGVTDAERSALTFTAYDLDLHLAPASSGISARAGLTVKNDAAAPLNRLVLQITSSTHWEAFSSAGKPLKFVSRLVDTDADHTGAVQEAVVTLPNPLEPGASMNLTALYSGAIKLSAERLERIGAPAEQARAEDWDAIATDGTALRGFGNVIWYPGAAPPVFLGDAAKLFDSVGRTKLREQDATIRLRLSVEYVGEAPDAVFFCGRGQQMKAIVDNPNMPAADAPGIATATFEAARLGFRTPDLFVTTRAAVDAGPPDDPGLISAVTDHDAAIASYTAAAAQVSPLLKMWLGPGTQRPLTILDDAGQPFEDDALLVRPMRTESAATLAPSLAHSLTHAWIRSRWEWIDEGLPQFMALLWTERTRGRDAAVADLQDAARPLAIAEPEATSSDSSTLNSQPARSPQPYSSSASDSAAEPAAGQPLIAASSDLFYRTKAANVWWMLRDLTGDAALQQALETYRSDPKLDESAEGMEQAIEKASHKDLRWFFNDWVYRDRGMPDLTIVNVTPSQLESRNGLPAGWLVAVDVHNDGYAVADVPVTVRSANGTQTVRLRIPGQSSASTRIVFAGTPEQVQVNDGSVPETRTSVHTRELMPAGTSVR